MTQEKATRPWGPGRMVIATIIFASIALNAILLWKWLGRDDHASQAVGPAAPGAERLAVELPSPQPVTSPKTERSRESQKHEALPLPPEVPVRPDGESRAAPEAKNDLQGMEPDPTPPVEAPPRESGYRRGADPASQPVAPSPTVATPRQPLPVSTHAPESLAGVPAAPSSASETTELVAPRGAATPSEARALTPAGGTTPEEKTAQAAEAGSDRTPPIIELLRFDPPVVDGGSATTLTVQASDDLSGVKSVKGEIQSPNRSASLPFWSQETGAGNVSAFAISIPREAEAGVWYISWISLTDGADNSSLVRAPSAAAAPPGGTFMVNSSESDSTVPEMLQVWFEKNVVDGGEKNLIRVEARDDRSGVDSIWGACQSPSKAALIWFNCALHEESGIWEGVVQVPANADCGEWVIKQLAAKDKAGNTTLLVADSPLLVRASFQVAFRADCDSVPPALDAFELSPTIVSNESSTEIIATATVHDEGSGTVTMTGWFEGPISAGGQAPKNDFSCSPDPKNPDTPWTCKIKVPQLAAKGIWKVGLIRLQDKALNMREYTSADPVLYGRVFEVQ